MILIKRFPCRSDVRTEIMLVLTTIMHTEILEYFHVELAGLCYSYNALLRKPFVVVEMAKNIVWGWTAAFCVTFSEFSYDKCQENSCNRHNFEKLSDLRLIRHKAQSYPASQHWWSCNVFLKVSEQKSLLSPTTGCTEHSIGMATNTGNLNRIWL